MAQPTAPTSRAREKTGGDEDAGAELKLGEFEGVPTLTLSEARLIIESILARRRKQRQVTETEYVCPVFPAPPSPSNQERAPMANTHQNLNQNPRLPRRLCALQATRNDHGR